MTHLDPLPRLLRLCFAMACAACSAAPSEEPGPVTPRRTMVSLGNNPAVEIHTEAGRQSRAIPVSVARVWEALDGVYAQLEIPVTRRDPRVREIGNLRFSARRIEGRRMNTYIDCGSDLSGQLANQYDVTVSVVTRLVERGDSTEVATLLDAFGKPRATSGNQVHCQSRHVLERRIADLVAGRFGIGGGGAR